MRRKQKEIQDRRVMMDILRSASVGHLGTINSEGRAMVKPVNFVYHEGRIYFHSACEGEKINDIRRDGRVCFEIDEPIGFVEAIHQPCEARYRFRSIIIRGQAAIVMNREERISALQALMGKYQPAGNWPGFPEEKLALTTVVKITIDEMTGKQDL